MSVDLEKKVKEQIQKAESLVKKLNTSIDTFENHNKRIITDCLRTKLINDIEKLSNKILKKAAEEEERIKGYSISTPKEVVWIRAVRPETSDKTIFNIEPYIADKESAANIASKLKNNPNYRCTSIPEFNLKLDSLKTDISKGIMNNILQMTAEEMLWKAMGASYAT